MHTLQKNLVVLGLISALPACAASEGRFPSLELRPFETGVAPAEPASGHATPAPTRPLTSTATLAALRDKAVNAHTAFVKQAPATERFARAAAGQTIESDVRARALVAMADITAHRGATATVLADIDLLVAEAAIALAPDLALAALQDEIATLLDREDAQIARLWKVMGP